MAFILRQYGRAWVRTSLRTLLGLRTNCNGYFFRPSYQLPFDSVQSVGNQRPALLCQASGKNSGKKKAQQKKGNQQKNKAKSRNGASRLRTRQEQEELDGKPWGYYRDPLDAIFEPLEWPMNYAGPEYWRGWQLEGDDRLWRRTRDGGWVEDEGEDVEDDYFPFLKGDGDDSPIVGASVRGYDMPEAPRARLPLDLSRASTRLRARRLNSLRDPPTPRPWVEDDEGEDDGDDDFRSLMGDGDDAPIVGASIRTNDVPEAPLALPSKRSRPATRLRMRHFSTLRDASTPNMDDASADDEASLAGDAALARDAATTGDASAASKVPAPAAPRRRLFPTEPVSSAPSSSEAGRKAAGPAVGVPAAASASTAAAAPPRQPRAAAATAPRRPPAAAAAASPKPPAAAAAAPPRPLRLFVLWDLDNKYPAVLDHKRLVDGMKKSLAGFGKVSEVHAFCNYVTLNYVPEAWSAATEAGMEHPLPREELLRCPTCGNKFTSEEKLRKHFKIHEREHKKKFAHKPLAKKYVGSEKAQKYKAAKEQVFPIERGYNLEGILKQLGVKVHPVQVAPERADRELEREAKALLAKEKVPPPGDDSPPRPGLVLVSDDRDFEPLLKLFSSRGWATITISNKRYNNANAWVDWAEVDLFGF